MKYKHLPSVFAHQSCSTSKRSWLCLVAAFASLLFVPVSAIAQITGRVFAPYIQMNGQSLTSVSQASGIKYFTLAFIIDNGSQQGLWEAGSSVASDTSIAPSIAALRAAGGDVIISFGGAAGNELAIGTTNVASLQAVYQGIINKYGVKALDFDIEGPALDNTTANDRRNQALAGLQAANPGLFISYTLPVNPTGLGSNSIALLQNAKSHGVNVACVNIMAMDYGSSTSPSMGANAVTASDGTIAQLSSIGLTAGIGITPLIGNQDTAPEVFTISDAQTVENYALGKSQVNRIAFWEVALDQCGSGCSGVAQTPWQFSHIFEPFSSATTTTVAAPVFSPGAGTFSSAQNVTITSATSGASIRYTTDGSTPSSTAGTLYSGPVNISATTTLKAIAFKSGSTDSSVTSGTYTISTGGGGGPVLQINAGGPAVAPFVADTGFDSGNQFSSTAAINVSGVTNAAPAAVYQSVRWNTAFNYTLTGLTAGSSYQVRLHFVELTWTAAGQRKFNVAINGATVLTAFDIFAQAGQNHALVQQFNATANSSGQIVVAFSQGGADNPTVAGLEVYSTVTGRSPFGGSNWPINNGAVIQAENYDLGGEGIAYHDAEVANQGGQYRTDGVDIEACTDTGTGFNVGWINDAEWLDYTVNPTGGTYNIVVRGASNAVPAIGSVKVLLDGVVLGTVGIPNTGGWQNWQDFTISNVAIAAGTGRTLQLQFVGGGFNLNYVRFVTTTTTFPLTVTNGTGSGNYATGTVVAIVANAPGAGQVFAGWTGGTAANFGNATSASTTYTTTGAAQTITATYSTVPTFALTVSSGTGSGNYAANTVVNIVANAPGAGQVFAGWTGGTAANFGNAASASTTYKTTGAAQTITATYSTVPTFALTVSSGSGSGNYPANTVVAIVANAPGTGQVFAGWTGGTAANFGNATLASTTYKTTGAAQTITATYTTVPTFALTVASGTGSGNYATGTVVNIVANAPGAGQVFAGWTGGTAANFGNAASASTTYKTTAAAQTITATYTTATATNLAVGKPITASSTTQSFVATNANDNSVTTYWEGVGFSPNLDVDLQANATVTQVVVKLDPSWGARTQTIAVWGHALGSTTFVQLSAATLYQFTPPANTATITLTTPATASVVRLVFSTNSGAQSGQAAEFQVIGTTAATFPLTVTSGTGSGNFAAGTVVNIVANAPPAGQVFAGWTGGTAANFGNAASSSTTYTTTGVAQTITATYSPGSGRAPFGGSNWPINNGAVIQAENYDLGGEGVAYHDADVANQGGQYRTDGVDIEACTDTGTGYNVGWINDGEWLDYLVNTTAGNYNIVIRGASNAAPAIGSVKVLLDGVVLGTVAIPNTGGWQNWQDFTISNVAIAAGTGRTLQLQFVGGGFNVNYVRFATATTTYPLTVTNGSGSGNYTAGTIISISANPPPTGQVFSAWTGGTTANFGNTASSSTIYTTIAAAQTITATYTNATQTPPNFGPNVVIFDPTMSSSTIQSRIDSIYSQQYSNQFGTARYALLFKPGSYNNSVNVGYYTQVLGLGQSPDNVTITGGVTSNAALSGDNATCNFWESAENLAVVPSGGTDQWATSQGCPLRRIHVKGSIVLSQNSGWASGGFLSDSVIDNQINSATQQQWISRNSQWGSWAGANWNMVFVGCNNAPSGASWPNPCYTVINQTPVVREKPFLVIDGNGNYSVFVPALTTNSQGITWSSGSSAGHSIPISQFYVAQAATDTAATLNAALSQGKNLLFTPGIYSLNVALQVNNPNTVILGLGLATLFPQNGVTAMTVADVDGVIVAGILFDAGATSSAFLLQVGPTGSGASHAANPTSLHDLFFRVGGAAVGRAAVSLQINSNNVIGDNFWIWRADHSNGVGWTSNTAANGLIVNGANVTIYGLFVEHYQQYQTLWNGNGGSVYFYQSEAPYDVPDQASWMAGSENGYASYKVADAVTSHQAYGVGVYCYFSTNSAVKLNNAIEVPTSGLNGGMIHNMTTVSLGGIGEITHVIDGWGGSANATANVVRLVQ